MAEWKEIHEGKAKVNVDLLVFVEKLSENKYKHCFIGGLTLILENPLIDME